MNTQTLVILFVAIHSTNSVDPCRTPDDRTGDCKPITKCQSLYPLYIDSLSHASAARLRQFQCGTQGLYPKVCCPVESPQNQTVLPQRPSCGFTLESRIFGGNKTKIDEFPWLALLQYNETGKIGFKCGGSLISRRYVLTARHCLRRALFSVRLGEWDVRSNPDCIEHEDGEICAPEAVDVPVEEQIPYRDQMSVQNDIGLIRLSKDVEYTDFVKPICLPVEPHDTNQSYLGEKLVVAGWGATEDTMSSSKKLKVLVPVRPLSLCMDGLSEAFRAEVQLHDGQICAGGEEGKDSCRGDSGGPLMYNHDKGWYAVGIVSFGPQGCGEKNRPSVYVKVAKFVQWVTDNMRP